MKVGRVNRRTILRLRDKNDYTDSPTNVGHLGVL